jgi:hypothetical protein
MEGRIASETAELASILETAVPDLDRPIASPERFASQAPDRSTFLGGDPRRSEARSDDVETQSIARQALLSRSLTLQGTPTGLLQHFLQHSWGHARQQYRLPEIVHDRDEI